MTSIVKKLSLALLAVAALATAPAQAAYSLGVAAVGDLSLYSSDVDLGALGTISTKGGLGFGAAVALEISVLEVDVMFVSRKTKVSSSLVPGVETSASASFLQFPVLYRMGLGPMSLGLGGYLATSLETGGGTDYGLTVGPKIKVPGGLFLDGRFNLGLKKDAADKANNAIQILIGYNFL